VAPDIHHPHAAVPQGAVPAYIDWLITSRRIDAVVMSHSFLGYHILPYLRARHPGVAFVDWVRTEWFEPHMYGSYSTMAARWADDIDVQLATSETLVRQLVQDGSRESTTRPAYIGIDTTRWKHAGPRHAALRAAVGAGPGTLVLLFSGRLSPEKRPALAVDTAAQLHADGVDVILVVAGNGPLLAATQSHATAAGISARVKFLGEMPEDKLLHIYSAADIFIAPSEIEGVSRSLYEAMAMGCVPVVTDVGGQRELVVDGTGTMVDPLRTDAGAYVDAIRPWLNPARRAQASAAARAHIVRRFDTARTVDTVLAAVEQAITVRPGRGPTVTPRMAEELAVMSLEITRRHVLRSMGR
jgi:glycosyltransferase involved in cell wall biosynthesis